MPEKLLSTIMAACTIYSFCKSIVRKRLTFKKFLCFLLIFTVCFLVYFKDDLIPRKQETASDVSNSPVSDQIPPQLSNDEKADTESFSENSSNCLSSEHPTGSPDDFPNESTDPTDPPVEMGIPFIEVTPSNQITSANLFHWDEENDRDIIGNTYSEAAKLTVSNTIDVLFGYGESEITVDVHFPFGGKATGVCNFSFVTAQEMVGNGSSAEITIFADGEELYPPFSLTSSTTEELTYPISTDGIRDLVLHFECVSIGNGFYAGIVLSDNAGQ